MRVLYLSFYYEPDLCAGSFRNTPLIKQLAQKMKEKGFVDLQTTMPNRYASFSEKASVNEIYDNLKVTRVQLPSHKSGFVDQIFAFKKFYSGVNKNIKGEKYDLVVASSSRLFTAFLGYRIASSQKIPLYLDIRDIFVDTLNDVLKNGIMKTFVLPFIKLIERKTFSYASHINLISEGFKPYFSNYNNATYSFFPNGIDKEFTTIESSPRNEQDKFVITYAGNIGEGQGLHKIIPQAAQMLGGKYQFVIIGDGGIKKALIEEINQKGIKNVQMIDPVSRKELLGYYQKTDFLFMHLNDYEAFKKVLPSKVFEYGATDKPIIAGVGGYAAEFVSKNVPNHILFEPGNVESLVNQLKNFDFSFKKRGSFIENYSREKINSNIVDSILK